MLELAKGGVGPELATSEATASTSAGTTYVSSVGKWNGGAGEGPGDPGAASGSPQVVLDDSFSMPVEWSLRYWVGAARCRRACFLVRIRVRRIANWTNPHPEGTLGSSAGQGRASTQGPEGVGEGVRGRAGIPDPNGKRTDKRQ